MERALTYLAAVTMLFAVLTAALPKFKQQPDFCTEAKRFAGMALVVCESKGWVIDAFLLDGVMINRTGIYHPSCGVAVQVPVANTTVLTGRKRLVMSCATGEILITNP